MKQKLLAVLATFVAVTPFVGVKAAEIQYSIGSEHNFLVNPDQQRIHEDQSLPQAKRESVGVKVVSLGQVTDDGFVKALATGAPSMTYGSPEPNTAVNSYKDLDNYKHMFADLNGNTGDPLSEDGISNEFKVGKKAEGSDELYDYVKDYDTDEQWIDIMSAEDFLTWMRGEKVTPASGTTYALNETEFNKFKLWFGYEIAYAEKYAEILSAMQTSNPTVYEQFKNTKMKYIHTKTYDAATNKIWTVELTMTGNTVTGATLKEVDLDDITADDGCFTVPILYFNKKYDCKYQVTTQQACFKCGDEYQWIEVGKQASTCEAVSSITKKAKCVKPSKTGVEDYILEFAIAAGICGLVLVAVKRKSLFSRV